MKYFVDTYKECGRCDVNGIIWVGEADETTSIQCPSCAGTKEIPAKVELERAMIDLLKNRRGFSRFIRMGAE